MGKKRVLVGYGIDVDAVANWINTVDGSSQNPTNVSRGVYGATVGIDRLLKLFDTYSIRATWFTPAHSVESFPKQIAKIRDGGHELGLHGYTHEYPSKHSPAEQQAILNKSVSVLTAFNHGKRPIGYTAPAWSTSRQLIPQLQAADILYDHSFMHHDVQMYWAPDSSENWVETDASQAASTWMKPMGALKASKVVEIPANWHLDDWPPLQSMMGTAGSHGFVDTSVVEKLWREQFDFAFREYESFVFPISIHPQVSGKPHVVLMHERIIEYINQHEGVEWVTFGDMAKEFIEGRMEGVTVEGGVDA